MPRLFYGPLSPQALFMLHHSTQNLAKSNLIGKSDNIDWPEGISSKFYVYTGAPLKEAALL